MSGAFNLPEDFSWRAFSSYYGDDQPPEPEDPAEECPHGLGMDEVCSDCDEEIEREVGS